MQRMCHRCGKFFETEDKTATICSICKVKINRPILIKNNWDIMRVKFEILMLKFFKVGCLIIFLGFIYFIIRYCL